MNNSTKLVVTKIKNITYVLQMDQKNIYNLYVENSNSESDINSIYIGKVTKINDSLDAAFVEYSKGAIGFLPLKDAYQKYKNLKCGEEILVQIRKDAIKLKAPLLSTNIQLVGKYCIVQEKSNNDESIYFSNKLSEKVKGTIGAYIKNKKVEHHFDIVIRSICGMGGLDYSFIYEEFLQLEKKFMRLKEVKHSRTCFSCLYSQATLIQKINELQLSDIGEQLEIITDDLYIYDNLKCHPQINNLTFYNDAEYSLNLLYGIQSKIEQLLNTKVWLKSGAYLLIEPTEALTVIDVNSGKVTMKTKSSSLAINKEAAKEIAKQIKLRNITGIIIIDFINMYQVDEKETLIRYMKELIKYDKSSTIVVDITPLGLMELTRKKVHKSLKQILGE